MILSNISKPYKHIVTLSFESGEELQLDSEFCETAGLIIGRDYSEDELLRLKKESDDKRAFSRACYYLSLSDHTKSEMLQKLIRAKFPESSAEYAANKLESLGYINDEALSYRLAQGYAERLISKREALFKLSKRGIEREMARMAIDEAYGEDEFDAVVSLISKKYASKLDSEDGARKVFAALARHGFGYDDIRRALKEFEFQSYND